jgi:tripartite-type tricarboxylate transporter receptor subunit TctC
VKETRVTAYGFVGNNPATRLYSRRHVLRQIGAAATVPLLGAAANAQDLPQTVRIVVGFPAGNPVEAAPRALAESLKQTSGRTYLIDNKPGAGGNLAAAEVAKSKPDGSSLLYITGGHTTAAALYKKLPFDPVADFTPVTQLVEAPGFAMLVRYDSPYRTIQDLIKAAQAKPNTISYASLGVGNTTHLLAELFARAVEAQFLHAPYRSSPMPDLLGGHVDFTWLGTSISSQLVEKKQARVLVVSSKARMSEAPDAPTFAEIGVRDVDVPAWSGFLAPAGMPPHILDKVYQEIVAATKHQTFVNYVKSSGDQRILVNPPAEFARYVNGETTRYRKVLAPLGIKLD